MMTLAPLPASISEADFQRLIIDLAKLHRWAVSHQRPARTRRGWATAIEGHAGAPDLLLARRGVVHLWELKSAKGVLSPEQRDWQRQLGDHYRIVRPCDWGSFVVPTLTERTEPQPQRECGSVMPSITYGPTPVPVCRLLFGHADEHQGWIGDGYRWT